MSGGFNPFTGEPMTQVDLDNLSRGTIIRPSSSAIDPKGWRAVAQMHMEKTTYPPTPPRPPMLPNRSAADLLAAAEKHMRDRAATYDKPEGERSMARTVQAFNAITGRDLAESDGWLLMQILKDVRDRQLVTPHIDSLEDCVAYAALKAEARMAGK